MTTKKPVKSHIKMYASDKVIADVKKSAEERGMSASAFLVLAARVSMANNELDKILGIQ